MKAIIAILTAIIYCLLCSCYTKKGCEQFCKTDTTTRNIIIRDTIVVQSVKADTVFSIKTDSFTIIKNNLIIKYKRLHDSIYISTDYKGDTIYKTKTIYIKNECKEVINKPTFKEKIITQATKGFAFFGLLALVIVSFRYIISKATK